MKIIIYLIVSLAFFSAYICGWKIVSFLEQNSVIKKNTPMRFVSWFSMFKYYKIKKERDGTYGFVGIVYIISLVILMIVGIFYLIETLLEPF